MQNIAKEPAHQNQDEFSLEFDPLETGAFEAILLFFLPMF